jgi:hypothetical protein
MLGFYSLTEREISSGIARLAEVLSGKPASLRRSKAVAHQRR